MGVRGDIKGYINFSNEVWFDLFRLSGKGKDYIVNEDADELCIYYLIEDVRVGCGGGNPVAYCDLVPYDLQHLDLGLMADYASFYHPCWAYIHEFLHDFLMCGVDEIKHRGNLDKGWLDTIWSEFELNDEAFDNVLDNGDVNPDADNYEFEDGEWVQGFEDACTNANPYGYALEAYASIDEQELREWAGEDWEDEVKPIYEKIKELVSKE
jgi:hypothetical protein